MKRTLLKAVRDLLVVAIGSVLLALGERATDFGVPAELAPAVAMVSLALYRLGRKQVAGDP